MAINPYHIVEEINGVRCSVVEKKISEERAEFLRKVLEFNKHQVQLTKVEAGSCTIGVENLIFNPLHAIYSKSLRTLEGKTLTPAYWYQKNQLDEYYWNYK